MELSNIEKLLKKYDNAETSLQEEQVLKNYFNNNDDVPTHLLEYKSLFNYFNESSEEQFTKTIQLKPRRSNWAWLSVAAAIVLTISIYTFKNDDGISDSDRREAELAYIETQKAFQLISQNLNKGENIAMAGLQEFEKAQNKVFKTKNRKVQY
ncbi:MAG: hypothetical protein WBM92_10715 [Aureibaculum sp.]